MAVNNHIFEMKLHADKPESHTITALGEGWVEINGERHERSLVLSSTGILQPWDCARVEDLTGAHFGSLLGVTAELPELVVFGSGRQLQFVKPSLMQALIVRRIGVETMNTAAACRTYNILAAEGRRVVLAILIGD